MLVCVPEGCSGESPGQWRVARCVGVGDADDLGSWGFLSYRKAR